MNTAKLQKMGGVSALVAAATFVVAIVLMVVVISPAGYNSPEAGPVENAAFMAENQAVLYLWNLVGYVIFGIFLVFLTLGMHERLKTDAPGLAQAAAAFGLIWAGLMFASGMVANIGAEVVGEVFRQDAAQAGSTWLALHFVVDGLGGGNEIVGGLWVLLLSWAGLRGGQLPRALNYFGVVVGAAGLVTLIPALGEVGMLFGLGSIAWFLWVGIVMLRSRAAVPAKAVVTASGQPAA